MDLERRFFSEFLVTTVDEGFGEVISNPFVSVLDFSGVETNFSFDELIDFEKVSTFSFSGGDGFVFVISSLSFKVEDFLCCNLLNSIMNE